ncbi:MAG: response regulator transcription factor [Saprospiraceae bacterium]|nr:response regulator transcription factor [Saprospiraceae bacterium]
MSYLKKISTIWPLSPYWTRIGLYAIFLAGLLLILKTIEYQYLVRNFTIEVYIGLIALLFSGLGIWIGLQIIKKRPGSEQHFEINQKAMAHLKLSSREYEILKLIATGLSNKEIAERLYISLPTVKTHISNLFSKLDVSRRTQAVKRGRNMGIIP